MSSPLLADMMLAALAATLVWAAIGDIRTFTIPNPLNAAIAAAAPLFWLAGGIDFWPDAVLRVAAAATVFALLAGAFYLGMMGGGDVKMAAAVLLWFPAGRAPDFMMVMAVAGGLVTVAALGRHRLAGRSGRPEVPYGVAIAAAGLSLIAERYLYQFS